MIYPKIFSNERKYKIIRNFKDIRDEFIEACLSMTRVKKIFE